MDSYIVICTNEDGESRISKHTRASLQKKLDEHYWGDMKIHRVASGSTELAEEAGLYIIHGEDVQPRPKETVTKWEV